MARARLVNNKGILTDEILERTSAAGVTIDGSLLKDGVVETDSVTITGLGGVSVATSASVAANGIIQSTATLITSISNMITSADASNNAIRLPSAAELGYPVEGRQFFIHNKNTGQALSVFPPSGGNINNSATNVAIVVANNTSAWFVAIGSGVFIKG